MNEWFGAIGFGIGLLAFVIGVTCLIMGITGARTAGIQQKIEYGFFGVAGLVVCGLITYALS